MARYDFGMSWEEFEETTPGMLYALGKRRNAAQRHERFANAQTAAAVYNTNRRSEDDPILSPFDFVRDDKSSEEATRMREMRKIIRSFGTLPGLSRKKMLALRRKMIDKLKATGHAPDAEEVFDDCWPSLKPKEGE